jgi:hypothetical protein
MPIAQLGDLVEVHPPAVGDRISQHEQNTGKVELAHPAGAAARSTCPTSSFDYGAGVDHVVGGQGLSKGHRAAGHPARRCGCSR